MSKSECKQYEYYYTSTTGHHCGQGNYNLEKGLRLFFLVVHNASFLHNFNTADKVGYLTILVRLPHPPL